MLYVELRLKSVTFTIVKDATGKMMFMDGGKQEPRVFSVKIYDQVFVLPTEVISYVCTSFRQLTILVCLVLVWSLIRWNDVGTTFLYRFNRHLLYFIYYLSSIYQTKIF